MDSVRPPSAPLQIGCGKLEREDFLLRANEFDFVRQRQRSFPGRLLVLNVAPARDGRVRLGLIVSRRYNLRAVHRNRARRMMRESFRLIRHGIAEPVWMVAIARKWMRGRKTQEVQAEMLQLLHRAGVWSEE